MIANSKEKVISIRLRAKMRNISKEPLIIILTSKFWGDPVLLTII